jgi:DNA-binding NarL/FixJ family response regulator
MTAPASAATETGTLRVVVADDQALVRVGFCGIIAATPGFAVVGEAGNGAEAVEAARRTGPDVILMDVRMPVISPATAKTHVAHLLTKLDARDRIQLVIIAYQSGLVTA